MVPGMLIRSTDWLGMTDYMVMVTVIPSMAMPEMTIYTVVLVMIRFMEETAAITSMEKVERIISFLKVHQHSITAILFKTLMLVTATLSIYQIC